MATATTYCGKTSHLFNSFRVATGLSWLCYYRALQMAPASWVAPIDKLSVVIAIILGVVLLGEPLSMKLVMGSLLILSGVLVLAL